MKTKLYIVAGVLVALALMVVGSACSSKADVASSNISKAAEQFQVFRRIVFINGITDKYLFTIQGYCSIETANAHIAGSVEVTCMNGKDSKGRPVYVRDNLGLSDNVTYMIQQLHPIHVSDAHYRVLFRPETIIPDFTR